MTISLFNIGLAIALWWWSLMYLLQRLLKMRSLASGLLLILGELVKRCSDDEAVILHEKISNMVKLAGLPAMPSLSE